MILRAGLTGGIASGKSTIGRHLATLGAIVIDADEVVRDLYRPGCAGHRALVSRYGTAILTPQGEIDRPALSRAALSTQEGADELNRLIHPLVIEDESRRIDAIASKDADGIVVIEATLLLESGGRSRCDCIIVVDVDPETQIARAVHRGLSEREARLRMSRQMSREQRLALADFVIDSSGPVAETLARTDEVWKLLRALLTEPAK